MAKVGLENDTLKQPKCPSNWEYSTGQRQLLDIQGREQMDRLSFSAQRRKAVQKGCFFRLTQRLVTKRPHLLQCFSLAGVARGGGAEAVTIGADEMRGVAKTTHLRKVSDSNPCVTNNPFGNI